METDEGIFRLVSMLSIRSAWPYAQILNLTVREATWLIAEMDRLDEQREIRLVEAYHNPSGLKERMEPDKASGRAAWAALASNMASTGQLEPEKAEGIRLKNAAVEFLEAKRG